MAIPILTSSRMREADQAAIRDHGIPGRLLMETAARGAWETGREMMEKPLHPIVVLCGPGNNGGDGLALARFAAAEGFRLLVLLVGDDARSSPLRREQLELARATDRVELLAWGDSAERRNREPSFALVVDALLGTGTSGPPRGDFAEAIAWGNALDAPALAIDLPSGLDADSGLGDWEMFVADITATMAALKPGLLLGRGAEVSGEIEIVDIGAPHHLYASKLNLLDRDVVSPLLLAPIDPRRHKYSRGKVLVIAGSRGMTGAGVLAAHAALRTGAGLVTLAAPATALAEMPQRLTPEIMTIPLPSSADGAISTAALPPLLERLDEFSAVAIGPGISRHEGVAYLVREIVAHCAAPIVLDADGLFVYSAALADLAARNAPLVITPHHGEMARLLGVARDAVSEDPLAAARRAVALGGCDVVLKGAPTVVVTGDGEEWILDGGNPGMATAGAGDVLTGMILAMLASLPVADAVTAAVWLHSFAGDIAAEQRTMRGMIAGDIIEAIPEAYARLEEE